MGSIATRISNNAETKFICMSEPVVPAQESIAALAENAHDAAGAANAAGLKKKASVPSVAYSKLFRWRWHDLGIVSTAWQVLTSYCLCSAAQPTGWTWFSWHQAHWGPSLVVRSSAVT